MIHWDWDIIWKYILLFWKRSIENGNAESCIYFAPFDCTFILMCNKGRIFPWRHFNKKSFGLISQLNVSLNQPIFVDTLKMCQMTLIGQEEPQIQQVTEPDHHGITPTKPDLVSISHVMLPDVRTISLNLDLKME